MERNQNRQRLIEDRNALQDAIKRALALNDDAEVERLKKDLNKLETYIKGEQK